MDTQHCPLCGELNQCSIVSGQPGKTCWCVTAHIDPANLQCLTPEQRNKACLCPACATMPDARERRELD